MMSDSPPMNTKDCGCGCSGLKKSDKMKAMHSLQAAALFFIVANPATYRLTRSILGDWVASDRGLASGAGLLLHSIVFALVVFVLMKVTLPSPY